MLKVLGRRGWDEWDGGLREPEGPAVQPLPGEGPRFRPRRVALTAVLVAIFATGAALSAVAGNEARGLADNGDPTAAGSTDSTTSTTDPTTTDTTTTAPDPAPAPIATTPAPTPPAAPAPLPTATAAAMASNHAGARPAVVAAPSQTTAVSPRVVAPSVSPRHVGLATVTKRKVVAKKAQRLVAKAKPQAKAPLPELEGPGKQTVWLNAAKLPDPTPPSMRLTPRFAARLAAVAKAEHVDWALMLAVLRVRGELGSAPAGPRRLRQLAGHLAVFGVGKDSWASAFTLSGETTFADRAIALSHYYRATGLKALVTGLEAAKPALEARVLNDPRLSIYSGGRHDVSSGRVDVRVLVVMEYLADAYNQVTVSCLITGHKLYARPGVISAHIFGRAVDIAALGGTSIAGHQGPGSLTEGAVRNILLLPPEVFPRQVISLEALGGPSFALANHWDHIHIGY